ncbi:SDR family oxidoreductase [Chryseobacterium fluminis]|uniref:SDR family NAD(P)-dependent oxidoreductase n=1 Tax=Chryseobacterium fluminis TaxID=2983606 RepID=UPI002258E382|nr:SDR family oxidoreductase [Chryseobacterium sp. MMS21-Ot14]UZT99064.1 SDR family oxidoreductase [Chryseobacterium sp. MMS21-Ot14]
MQVSLITGATSGIGEALARKLAKRKRNLLLVARNEQKLKECCSELAIMYGIEAHYIVVDLSKPEAANFVFEESKRKKLSVDLLINNAGIGSSGEFTQMELQSELKLIQLNIASLVSLSHLFLTEMKNRKSGSLINIASMTAFTPFPYMATYAASKVFVKSFTQAITEEYRSYGIQVVLACPGVTRTNFNHAAGLDNEKAKALSSEYTENTTQTAEEVAIEILNAFDRKKTFVVAGSRNRFLRKIFSIIPTATFVKFLANSYRKKTNQNL